MFFILRPDTAIRHFSDAGYVFIRKHIRKCWNLTNEEFELIRDMCDGKHDLVLTQSICDLANDGVIIPVVEGDYPRTKWQVAETDTKICLEMKVAITQKCNYDCKYCFTEFGEGHLKDEYTYEEFTKLIDEALEIGMSQVSFTGGEPFMHKDFLKMIKYVYENGMTINEILTNGSLITQEILDYLKDQYYLPEMRISFDGINNKHNEIRQTNSDEKVIDNIKLCIANGFHTRITYNLSHFNLEELRPTVEYLENIGVNDICIARTTPTPKWNIFAPNTEIGITEWYDIATDFLKWFTHTEHTTNIDFWNDYVINQEEKTISVSSIRNCCKGFDDDKQPICLLAPYTICINGDGGMTPCHQVSGALKYEGIDLGNAKKDGLYNLMKDSKFADLIYTTTKERREHLEECSKCEYYKYCLGGCPIICWNYRRDKDNFPYYLDLTKCAFFKGNYYKKMQDAISEEYRILEEM